MWASLSIMPIIRRNSESAARDLGTTWTKLNVIFQAVKERVLQVKEGWEGGLCAAAIKRQSHSVRCSVLFLQFLGPKTLHSVGVFALDLLWHTARQAAR